MGSIAKQEEMVFFSMSLTSKIVTLFACVFCFAACALVFCSFGSYAFCDEQSVKNMHHGFSEIPVQVCIDLFGSELTPILRRDLFLYAINGTLPLDGLAFRIQYFLNTGVQWRYWPCTSSTDLRFAHPYVQSVAYPIIWGFYGACLYACF